MKSFHVVCAKDNKKIELVLKFNSVEEVKKWLHKQNYSIINIEEIKDEMINKTGLFYFDTIIN
jgi:DNA-dependent RNA polymerase auxiliary subunit epsilon